MNNERKIDINGKLLPNASIENSSFFKLLLLNNNKAIEDWLINNGNIKPYCPIRFLSEDKKETIPEV